MLRKTTYKDDWHWAGRRSNKEMSMMVRQAATAALIMFASSVALAQVKIGVTVSATGPAASLGIPERNAVALMPKVVGKHKIEYVILDDASDTTLARRNFEKLVTQDKVDLVIGSSTSPASLAMIGVASQSSTPMISLGAARSIIDPMDQQRRWVFKTPYNDEITASATARDMAKNKIKTVGFIGFNDAYGESWNQEFAAAAKKVGIQVVATESYNRTDMSVTSQVLRVLIMKPDAVLIAASGTPAVLPQSTLVGRGYKGRIYQTTGVTNNDFIRVGGKSVEGTFVAAAPVVVAGELPVNHPARETALELKRLYEQANGDGTLNSFAGYAWDAWLIAKDAILRVGEKAAPGTPEFRKELRDAIEATKNLATTNGLVTMSASDHNGFNADAPVLINVRDGKWAIAR